MKPAFESLIGNTVAVYTDAVPAFTCDERHSVYFFPRSLFEKYQDDMAAVDIYYDELDGKHSCTRANITFDLCDTNQILCKAIKQAAEFDYDDYLMDVLGDYLMDNCDDDEPFDDDLVIMANYNQGIHSDISTKTRYFFNGTPLDELL